MVGVFVLSTFLIFALAVLESGRVRQWFNPGVRIKVILPEDGLFGLSEGAAVEILGTKAGKVVKIVIDPDQKMYADVQIQNDMMTFVRQDSQSTIRKQFGVAGAAYLEITRGFGESLDWEYAVLEARADRAPTETVGSLIEEVRNKVFPVIDDTQAAIRTFLTVAQDLQNPDGSLQQLLTGLSTISSKIARGEGAVGRLITQEALADDLEAMLSDVNQIIKRLAPVLDDLTVTVRNVSGLSGKFSEQAKDLPKMSQTLQDVLVSVNAVLKDLSKVTPELPRITRNVGETTTNIPVLLIQTQQVMAELDQLLRQLQSSWLLGGKAEAGTQTSSRISPLEVRP
ncbi:MAG: MCE family protein [Desulfobacterales bacterium]|nr:MAG: MCE family protein [Desulfobacterales bacterium]